jgi:hypothetical protein
MHTHAHPHAHSHGHLHGAGASERRIGLAAVLTGVFMVAEFAGGLISGSLALIADAGHMLTDSAGLTLAWLGFRLARRPADWKRSYGYDRFGVLVAFANGLLLFAIAGWIVVEAVHRFRAPSPVLGGVMLWVALAGLVVNLIAFRLLAGGDHENLNVRAAALHVIGDLLGSLAALAAAVVILATGWTPIDPIMPAIFCCKARRPASIPRTSPGASRPPCRRSSTCITCTPGRSARSGRSSRCTRASRTTARHPRRSPPPSRPISRSAMASTMPPSSSSSRIAPTQIRRGASPASGADGTEHYAAFPIARANGAAILLSQTRGGT